MMVGDTHGNISWLRTYIYPVAMTLGVERVVVLGDFGAWEHTINGVRFFNECNLLAQAAGIPLYWLHGNHDKWSHTAMNYRANHDGFLVCRDQLFYIPQGHSWSWGGVNYRAFGGAYSIDKNWRVNSEKDRYHHARMVARKEVGKGNVFSNDAVPSFEGTLWFPEEEMTDAEMDELLREDGYRKDIILSHDKPLSSTVGWNRRSFPACVPNQLRLDHALKTHKPRYWLHGHLHYFYSDHVYGTDWETTILGLDPDAAAQEHEQWSREHTWAVVEVDATGYTVTDGSQLELNMADLLQAKMDLHVRAEWGS